MNGAPSIDRKGETLVFLREDSVTPREVWALRLPRLRPRGRKGAAAPAPKPLTDTNPQVRDLLSFPKELVTWKGADGWDMEGLLVYPAGYTKGSRVPLALNVHGGPAGTHSNAFTPAPRLWGWPLFAQKGYAIFFPNPRGSGGYGEKFRAANVRDWGVKDYEDLMQGVDALVERGIADPRAPDRERLVVRRLHDLHDRDEDRPLQVGDRGRRGHEPRLVHRHRRHPGLRALLLPLLAVGGPAGLRGPLGPLPRRAR